jgi:hypothetical protein
MRMARNIAGIGVLGCLPLLAACGDPVAPAPQASVSIHIKEYERENMTYGNKRCPPALHWLNVPYQRDRGTSAQSQQTNDSTADVRAVNGQEGAKVSCSVKPAGSGFTVSLSASGIAQNMDKRLGSPIVNIRIPSIGEGDSSASGTLSIQDDTTAGNQYFTDLCTFSVAGGAMGIQEGGIWGSITCEGLSEPKTPDSACQVDQGYFVFENCAK